MMKTLTSADYKAVLDEMYRKHYPSGRCPYYEECFASAGSGPKFAFDFAAKVGVKYGEPGSPKILIVGQEGKTGHQEVGKTTESIDPRSGANNDHYRKTLYTLALLFGRDTPLGYANADLVAHEDLLQRFCLTNYFKCAISGDSESDCRGLHHTRAMKDNCYNLLAKEIDVLEPDIVVIQGKFTPPPFGAVIAQNYLMYIPFVCAIINKKREGGRNMTEKILLVPGANGTELIRMLARFGKNSLGLRIMNATEFAKYALMHSGVTLEKGFLPRKQEPALVDGFVREVPYFSSASYADSEKLANAIYSIRSLITENEEEHLHRLLPGGEFPEKNRSLVTVYDRYLAALRAARHIDTIDLIRKAVEEAEPLTCSVYTLQEYPLTPLEEVLVNRLTGDRIHICLHQLLEKDIVPLQDIDYTESYGSSNEIETIYNYIAEKNIPFDECTVAITNTTQYAQLIYDFSQSHDLPITLGCGIPILNTNPARLLKLLHDWNTTGYNGTDALRVLLCNDAIDYNKLRSALRFEHAWQLDKIISIAGQLRLGFHKEENRKKLAALSQDDENMDLRSCVAALSEELAQGASKLIKKYARIRDGAIGRADRSALSVICDALDAYSRYTGASSLNQIIPQILQKSVCSENSREGSLFVTDIFGAMASMRRHLFIAGMSASNFPGTPRENYLLLDSDYLLFTNENTAPTSINIIQRNKDALDNLLALASALGVKTHISYSGYDLAALKEENPSSVLFDIFKKQYGTEATLKKFKDAFRHVGYFGQQVSGHHTVGHAYVEGKDICFQAADFSQAPCAYTGDQAFSPTVIDDFFNCPRHFFLTRILGVRESEQDDPFVVIDPSTSGRLAHSLMEELAHTPCDRDVFLQKANTAFDKFLLSRPPIHEDIASIEKNAFCKMMENAYDLDPKNKVLITEEDQSFRHSSGVLLCGIPDRVEQTAEGEYIIADYKTGKHIRHVPDDIGSCLQVVIYAYLLEQRGIPIARCEYRYLRHGLTVPCRYDPAMKEKLNARLLEFKNALDTGEFPPAKGKDTCTYCTLAGICGKESQKKEELE